jgi:hypothetical protein
MKTLGKSLLFFFLWFLVQPLHEFEWLHFTLVSTPTGVAALAAATPPSASRLPSSSEVPPLPSPQQQQAQRIYQSKPSMSTFLFTSESVNEGHPGTFFWGGSWKMTKIARH